MLGSINNLATSLNVPGASNVNTSGTASVNIPGANGTTNKTVTPNADNTGVADAEAKTPSDVKPRTARGSASAPADDSDDSSDIVKQLKKQIEKLQKQLQKQIQEMQRIQSSNQAPEAKAAALTAAQAAVAITSSAIQEATATLLQVLTAQGSSRSGSMVSTSA